MDYDFHGFFQPVDNPPALNTANAGRAIPVKFSLNGNQGLGIFPAGWPASQQIACSTSVPLDAIEDTVTGGSSSLSYDPASDILFYPSMLDGHTHKRKRVIATFFLQHGCPRRRDLPRCQQPCEQIVGQLHGVPFFMAASI